ncbi:MAG TPA: hypothetical protein VFC79_13090, partial [Tissierellaceae bacterium]|nr:hypothetical protein [Tissierellaceae bacterium]
MSIIDNNFADPIISQWNRIGEDKVSKKIENELCTVTTNMFALRQIPDMQYRVQIDGYVEIDIRDEINLPAQFKVDYEMGYVYFHPSKEGEKINVNQYYGRGVSYYPANRVWTKLNDDGDIDETLEDITDKMEGALDLSDRIQAAEDLRIDSEGQRKIDENTRKSNEVIRKDSEVIRESSENQRNSDEDIRLANEIVRKSSEDVRNTSELQRVEDENVRISNENVRISDEDTRIANEDIRIDNENTREIQENDRQTNTSVAIDAIYNTNDNFKIWGEYDNGKLYKPLNKVQYQGSSYLNILECTGVVPTNTGNWQLIAAKGLDGVGGDMYKYIYDTNDDGIVDMAEDSGKLQGKTLVEIYEDIPEGTTVVDSATNGNILVNGDEIQVYDDTEIDGKIIGLEGVGRTTETVKDNSDKIGILNGSGETREKADKELIGLLSNLTTEQKVNLVSAINEIDNNIKTHKADMIHQEEVHGIRLNIDKKLEYFDGEEWVEVKGGGGSTVPIGNISNFVAEEGDAQVILTWKDPEDIVVEGIVVSKWKGTKILRKTGSYSANENDGILVIDSGVKNQYEVNGFTDTGLVNDTKYFYMAFPYTDDVVTVDIANRISATPTAQKIYGVEIDEANSNPETSVAYIDDAIGFTPMTGNDGSHQWGSWQSIFDDLGIKPVMLKNGVEQYDINPNDYTKKVDGTNADITSGNDGDVMIKFPKIYWKINRVGTKLQVRFSTEIFDGAICNAHTVGNIEKDSIYISAYKGSNLSNKLRSLSGKAPYVGGTAPAGTIGTCRTMAQANGNGYQQMGYYPLLMLQVLYLVFFKNLDSQTALGRGYVDGNASAINTGGANTKGMFYGETTGKLQNKFCGIEDFYG